MDTYLYWCDKCGKRFAREASGDTPFEAAAICCSACTGAKVSQPSSGKMRTTPNLRAAQTSLSPARSTPERPPTERNRGPHHGASQIPRERFRDRRQHSPSMLLGGIGAGTVALLVILVFALGGQKSTAPTAQKADAGKADTGRTDVGTADVSKAEPPDRMEPQTGTKGGTEVQVAGGPVGDQVNTGERPPQPDPPVAPADAETRAREAFDALEAQLKQLPEDDKDGRLAACEGFLTEHGSTIIAARVRTMVAGFNKAPPEQETPTNQTTPGGKVLVSLGASEFQGGQYYKNFKGAKGRAVWGLGTDTHTMKAALKLCNKPDGTMALEIRSLRNDPPKPPAAIRISINQTVVYEGRDKNTSTEWKVSSYELPQNLMKQGDNSLEIVCTEDSKVKHKAPWFMLNELKLVTVQSSPRAPDEQPQ